MLNLIFIDDSTKVELIHDSYINLDEEEWFLCKLVNMDSPKWICANKISNQMREEYTKRKRNINAASCNTDKTAMYACDVKVKSRGILLAVTNCGVILSYREIFGSESITQVSNFYLDTIDNLQSKALIIYV